MIIPIIPSLEGILRLLLYMLYAPYMPCVPTQLLGFADGAMSQGFSTLYALEPLNPNLVVVGRVTA